MSPYELSQRQEVLMEKGAGVLGDLHRYQQENHIEDDLHPVNIMFSLVWNAKEDILGSKTDAELDRIDGKFDLAKDFLRKLTTPPKT